VPRSLAALAFALTLASVAPASAQDEGKGEVFVAAAGGYQGAYLGLMLGASLARDEVVGGIVGFLAGAPIGAVTAWLLAPDDLSGGRGAVYAGTSLIGMASSLLIAGASRFVLSESGPRTAGLLGGVTLGYAALGVLGASLLDPSPGDAVVATVFGAALGGASAIVAATAPGIGGRGRARGVLVGLHGGVALAALLAHYRPLETELAALATLAIPVAVAGLFVGLARLVARHDDELFRKLAAGLGTASMVAAFATTWALVTSPRGTSSTSAPLRVSGGAPGFTIQF